MPRKSEWETRVAMTGLSLGLNRAIKGPDDRELTPEERDLFVSLAVLAWVNGLEPSAEGAIAIHRALDAIVRTERKFNTERQ
jgi:hypothetical protein